MTEIVALRGVTRVFPATRSQAEVRALGPIDLDLTLGEFFAVVGPSGCGKSTLLEIIAGLSAPTEGSVTLAIPGDFSPVPWRLLVRTPGGSVTVCG